MNTRSRREGSQHRVFLMIVANLVHLIEPNFREASRIARQIERIVQTYYEQKDPVSDPDELQTDEEQK